MFTVKFTFRLIDDVNSSQIGEAQLAHFADLAARSITGCAARHSNASRYKLLGFTVYIPNSNWLSG